jgi:hypothetical protein
LLDFFVIMMKSIIVKKYRYTLYKLKWKIININYKWTCSITCFTEPTGLTRRVQVIC